MTDAIDFLEQLGRNARLRHAPTPELERVLAASGIEPSCAARCWPTTPCGSASCSARSRTSAA